MLAALTAVLTLATAGCTATTGPDPGADRASSAGGGPGPPPISPAAAAKLPNPLQVVGLGDSVTAAAHCGCPGFVPDYAGLVRSTYDVLVTAVGRGVSGATTGTLLTSLRSPAGPAGLVARADVVSVTIGANDLGAARAAYDAGTCGGDDDLDCFTPAVAEMRSGLTADLGAIAALTAGHPVQVLVNDYWNVFEDGDVSLRENGADFVRDSDEITRLANRAICAAARASGAICVDTYAPYKGEDGGKDPTELLAPDGDHPDAAGHEVIARAMLKAGLPALLG